MCVVDGVEYLFAWARWSSTVGGRVVEPVCAPFVAFGGGGDGPFGDVNAFESVVALASVQRQGLRGRLEVGAGP